MIDVISVHLHDDQYNDKNGKSYIRIKSEKCTILRTWWLIKLLLAREKLDAV